MLIGEYSHNLDSKGRLIIPSKFREILGDDFVITRGLDHCLSLYPKEQWEKFSKNLGDLPFINSNARNMVRFITSGSSSNGYDKQGRVLIPGNLQKHASLKKEVILVGVLNRVEIWDKELWDNNNAEIESNMDDIARQMEELGLSI